MDHKVLTMSLKLPSTFWYQMYLKNATSFVAIVCRITQTIAINH